jgi:hypothetical protein
VDTVCIYLGNLPKAANPVTVSIKHLLVAIVSAVFYAGLIFRVIGVLCTQQARKNCRQHPASCCGDWQEAGHNRVIAMTPYLVEKSARPPFYSAEHEPLIRYIAARDKLDLNDPIIQERLEYMCRVVRDILRAS